MKKQVKKTVSFFITLSLIFSLFTLYPLQASAMTNQDRKSVV